MECKSFSSSRRSDLGLILVLAWSVPLLAGFSSEEANLSAQESAEIVALLQKSRNDTLTTLASLSDEQWAFKPGPERWSAGEVAEHLYLSEAGFRMSVERLLASEPNPDWRELTKGKTETIAQVIPDRTNRAQSPPDFAPKGTMSRAEIINGYAAQRSKMIERAQDQSTSYKAHIGESGTPLGTLGADHWIRFAALHNQRHNRQIDEVLADPKFPK